jgi:hypothetical protein
MEPIREEPTRYRSFLLRCWEARGVRPEEPGEWRFRLECVQTGEKRAFPELATLMEFILGELERVDPGPAPALPEEHKRSNVSHTA